MPNHGLWWQRESSALFHRDIQQHNTAFQGAFLLHQRGDLHPTSLQTMSRKRKENRKPQKLTEFFSQWPYGGRQDGAGSSSSTPHNSHSLSAKSASTSRNSGSPTSPQSYPNTPQSASPAKAKFRVGDSWCSPAASPSIDSGEDTRELPYSIEELPTMNQPVTDTVLKDMLLSLQSSLQADMMSCMQKFNKEIQAVKSRVNHIETKTGGFCINC